MGEKGENGKEEKGNKKRPEERFFMNNSQGTMYKGLSFSIFLFCLIGMKLLGELRLCFHRTDNRSQITVADM